jgi:hypothetical protein
MEERGSVDYVGMSAESDEEEEEPFPNNGPPTSWKVGEDESP